MNVGVAAEDNRVIEVLASGLPCFHGAQLAVDITLRSAITADGEARPGAAREDGVTLIAARADKENKYAELVSSRRCRLVVFALETGGRWSDEAAEFTKLLAEGRAREAPPFLRKAASLAWNRRWTRLLSTACAVAFAASLLEPAAALEGLVADGTPPSLLTLFEEDVHS
jgi:hypothetical protein